MPLSRYFAFIIGVNVCLLSILRFFNWIQIDSKFISSYSIAALFLVLADAGEYLNNVEKTDQRKKINSKVKRLITVACYFLGGFSIMILPHMPNVWEAAFNDFVVLASIGMSIMIIGYRGLR
ncbi:hypothetical protein [Paenibacillus sp. MSJ-34]|uniref:hypothetical protein n=1 Tax=Paenibacillus sp. MSJ-34 TaxID=2841529 RepID=UPI001C10573C|nr:hypothetical protein [Paenibacillus sp. MSJ-34]MBU5445429.1 hypothetical protein [Paenibacillus sp. MSJ-34]